MMSTAERLLDQDDVRDFCEALRDWPNSETVGENFALAVGPFVSFYFSYMPSNYVETSLLLVDLHNEYEILLDHPYRIATHPDSERPHPYGSKRLPDLRQFARKTPLDRNFLFSASDEKNPLSSPNRAAHFWRAGTWDGVNNIALSHVQLHFSYQWWLDHRDAWQRFVLSAADRLGADQVYCGFSMTNPLDIGTRYEVATWERALSPHFYGLDIDFPFGMSRDLQEGVRPPTWGFLLSERWRGRLGCSRDEVRKALDDPQIQIVDCDSGQWIELGSYPSLCPVTEGVPPLQARLNRLLRPIRLANLGLVGLGQWDGDPNERFSHLDSQRWLARFDEDSDWPSAEVRRVVRDAYRGGPPASVTGGLPCPRAGWWFTPAREGSRRHFAQGETMPELGSDYGASIWQWDDRQT
jgi:Protein of unknown function (DUF3396)